MSVGGSTQSCAPTPASAQSIGVSLRSVVVSRLVDYLELTKPRIAIMALFTVTVGYILGSTANWQLVPLMHALFGIALVAFGSSALNQYFERQTDAFMLRTSTRPLPAGRLTPAEVLLFGLGIAFVGMVYLAFFVNGLTASLAVATFLLYTVVYTPLKRVTSLCTPLGAIPGALPPVLGWAAAGGSLNSGSYILFGILFLWQFPHFLAICWLYRDQYAQAGLRMLPWSNPAPRVTGFLCVAYALVLLPVSLLPSQVALAGERYFLAAVVLGLGYLLCAIRFMLNESVQTARGLIWSSLIYLPLLLMALCWDHFQLLR